MTDTKPFAARIVAVLHLFAENGGPLTLTEIGAGIGLPQSSAHRVVNALVDEGLIERAANRRYRIGSEFLRLATLIETRHDIVAAARPLVAETAERSGETCLLGVVTGDRTRLLLAHKADSPHKLRFKFDMMQNIPLLWGSLGRSAAAWLDGPSLSRVLAAAGPSPLSGAPLPDREVLEAEFAQIRRMGFATSHGHRAGPDAIGISAAILDADNRVRGALGVVTPEFRLDPEKRESLVRLVRSAAAEVSHAIGHRRGAALAV